MKKGGWGPKPKSGHCTIKRNAVMRGRGGGVDAKRPLKRRTPKGVRRGAAWRLRGNRQELKHWKWARLIGFENNKFPLGEKNEGQESGPKSLVNTGLGVYVEKKKVGEKKKKIKKQWFRKNRERNCKNTQGGHHGEKGSRRFSREKEGGIWNQLKRINAKRSDNPK